MESTIDREDGVDKRKNKKNVKLNENGSNERKSHIQ